MLRQKRKPCLWDLCRMAGVSLMLAQLRLLILVNQLLGLGRLSGMVRWECLSFHVLLKVQSALPKLSLPVRQFLLLEGVIQWRQSIRLVLQTVSPISQPAEGLHSKCWKGSICQDWLHCKINDATIKASPQPDLRFGEMLFFTFIQFISLR